MNAKRTLSDMGLHAETRSKIAKNEGSSRRSPVTSTEQPKTPETLEANETRTLSLGVKCHSNIKIGSCAFCGIGKVSTNTGGDRSCCNNCGAKFHKNDVVKRTVKLDDPCFNQLSRGNSAQDFMMISGTSVKASTSENRPVLDQTSEKPEVQVLRNLIYGFSENLSLTLSEAYDAFFIAQRFFKHLERRRLRGKNKCKLQSRDEAVLELASASLLISCRQSESGITLKQMSKETKVPMSSIVSRKNEIEKIFGTSITTQGSSLNAIVRRTCKMLDLPPMLVNIVRESAESALKLDPFHGLNPSTVVSSCIYLVAQVAELNLSSQDIVKVTCVSDHSMRRLYKQLLLHIGYLLPEDFMKKFGHNVDIPKLLGPGRGVGSKRSKQLTTNNKLTHP